jgi:hypothetical protein
MILDAESLQYLESRLTRLEDKLDRLLTADNANNAEIQNLRLQYNEHCIKSELDLKTIHDELDKIDNFKKRIFLFLLIAAVVFVSKDSSSIVEVVKVLFSSLV